MSRSVHERKIHADTHHFVTLYAVKDIRKTHQTAYFEAKMHQIRFRLGLRSLTPRFKGPTYKRRGKKKGGKGKGEEIRFWKFFHKY